MFLKTVVNHLLDHMMSKPDYFWNDHVEEDEKGGACSMHRK